MLTSIVLYEVYSTFLKRTPEKLLKQQFNISLAGFDYAIETFEEQWHPNGNGEVLVIYKFNKLTQENVDYLKTFNPQTLPIPETYRLQMPPNKIPKNFSHAETGYYIYESESTADYRDFKVFILDIERKIAVLYYQFD